MRLFDLVTWVAVVILVVGSSGIFVWFLKDAGKVLRGNGTTAPRNLEEPSEELEKRG